MKLRKDFEDALWHFFNIILIVPLILKHQVGCIGDSKEKQFEDLLLKAIDGQSPQVVMLLVHTLNLCLVMLHTAA